MCCAGGMMPQLLNGQCTMSHVVANLPSPQMKLGHPASASTPASAALAAAKASTSAAALTHCPPSSPPASPPPIMSQHSRKGDRRQCGAAGWNAFYSAQVQLQPWTHAPLPQHLTPCPLQFGQERWALLLKVQHPLPPLHPAPSFNLNPPPPSSPPFAQALVAPHRRCM